MKKYFIGIDSDGTAFDSMTIKHRKAFIPAMIKVWHLEGYADKVSEICEYINLYSPTRGIDRFSGLKITFDRFKEAGIPVPDYIDTNVSDKVVRVIQSYVGVVNKMVWRKS